MNEFIEVSEMVRLYDNSLDIATYSMMIIGTIWWTSGVSIYNLVAGMCFFTFATIIAMLNFRRKRDIIDEVKRRLKKEQAEWKNQRKQTK